MRKFIFFLTYSFIVLNFYSVYSQSNENILKQRIFFAQTQEMIDELSYEQSKIYNRMKLSIELEGISMTSYNSNPTISSSWRKWTAYKGFNEISEAEFFRETGYMAEALQAEKYRKSTKKITTWGLMLAIFGCGTSAIGISNENNAFAAFGILLGSFGTGMIMRGAVRSRTNWAPYSTVNEIKETYNKKLLLKIKMNL